MLKAQNSPPILLSKSKKFNSIRSYGKNRFRFGYGLVNKTVYHIRKIAVFSELILFFSIKTYLRDLKFQQIGFTEKNY